MSASDHVNPRLFHGTGHYFGPGETIDPRSPGANPSRENPTINKTYATSNMEYAQYYAKLEAWDKGMLFAPVYEVKMENPERFANELYSSTKPLVPKKIAGWGTWNQMNEDE
jgi:hypothetical protein